jgi:hypothetical protein
MEAKVFVDSLGLWALCFVKIDNLPLLMFASVVTPDTNLMAFFVFTSSNIKDLVVGPVNKLAVLILEDLEPS